MCTVIDLNACGRVMIDLNEWDCVFDVSGCVMNTCGCVVIDFNACGHVVITCGCVVFDLNACGSVVIDLKACRERVGVS